MAQLQQSQSRDQTIRKLVSWLVQKGAFHEDHTFDAECFGRFKQRLAGQIHVPRTTITPMMERMLFAAGSSSAVRKVAVLGSYYGYALLWLAGGMLENECSYVAGFDVDPNVCEQARQNVSILAGHIEIFAQDAYQGIERFEDRTVDLLLIDVERDRSKADYAGLLEAWFPKLRPGGLILAHDPVVELFARDFDAYHAKLHDPDRFVMNITLPIDECGLDVTRVAQGVKYS